MDKADLFREAIKTFVRVRAAKRLAALGAMECGLVDMILLTSTLITPGAKLWTLDKRLAKLAEHFGVAHRVAVH